MQSNTIMQNKNLFLCMIILSILCVSCGGIRNKLQTLSAFDYKPFQHDTVITRMDARNVYYINVDSLFYLTWFDNNSTIQVRRGFGGRLDPDFQTEKEIPYNHIDSLLSFFRELNVSYMEVDGQGNARLIFPWKYLYEYEVLIFNNEKEVPIGFSRDSNSVIYRKRRL